MKFTKLKKHLAVILSAAMVFSCFPATAMAAEPSDEAVAVESGAEDEIVGAEAEVEPATEVEEAEISAAEEENIVEEEAEAVEEEIDSAPEEDVDNDGTVAEGVYDYTKKSADPGYAGISGIGTRHSEDHGFYLANSKVTISLSGNASLAVEVYNTATVTSDKGTVAKFEDSTGAVKQGASFTASKKGDHAIYFVSGLEAGDVTLTLGGSNQILAGIKVMSTFVEPGKSYNFSTASDLDAVEALSRGIYLFGYKKHDYGIANTGSLGQFIFVSAPVGSYFYLEQGYSTISIRAKLAKIIGETTVTSTSLFRSGKTDAQIFTVYNPNGGALLLPDGKQYISGIKVGAGVPTGIYDLDGKATSIDAEKKTITGYDGVRFTNSSYSNNSGHGLQTATGDIAEFSIASEATLILEPYKDTTLTLKDSKGTTISPDYEPTNGSFVSKKTDHKIYVYSKLTPGEVYTVSTTNQTGYLRAYAVINETMEEDESESSHKYNFTTLPSTLNASANVPASTKIYESIVGLNFSKNGGGYGLAGTGDSVIILNLSEKAEVMVENGYKAVSLTAFNKDGDVSIGGATTCSTVGVFTGKSDSQDITIKKKSAGPLILKCSGECYIGGTKVKYIKKAFVEEGAADFTDAPSAEKLAKLAPTNEDNETGITLEGFDYAATESEILGYMAVSENGIATIALSGAAKVFVETTALADEIAATVGETAQSVFSLGGVSGIFAKVTDASVYEIDVNGEADLAIAVPKDEFITGLVVYYDPDFGTMADDTTAISDDGKFPAGVFSPSIAFNHKTSTLAKDKASCATICLNTYGDAGTISIYADKMSNVFVAIDGDGNELDASHDNDNNAYVITKPEGVTEVFANFILSVDTIITGIDMDYPERYVADGTTYNLTSADYGTGKVALANTIPGVTFHNFSDSSGHGPAAKDGSVLKLNLKKDADIVIEGCSYGTALTQAALSSGRLVPRKASDIEGYSYSRDDGGEQRVYTIASAKAGEYTVSFTGTEYIHAITVDYYKVNTGVEIPADDTGSENWVYDHDYLEVFDFAALDSKGLSESETTNGKAVPGLVYEGYENKTNYWLTKDIINGWWPDADPGTQLGTTDSLFPTSLSVKAGQNTNAVVAAGTDPEVQVWGYNVEGGGTSVTNHRLRTLNKGLTRMDAASKKDANGVVFPGYIYSNSSAGSTTGGKNTHMDITADAGDKITVWTASNGGVSTIHFMKGDEERQVEKYLASATSAVVEPLVFYAKDSGKYSIYSEDEKLVVARIVIEHAKEATVTGSITEATNKILTDYPEYKVMFINDTTGAITYANRSGSDYSVKLPAGNGYSYIVSLSGAKTYVISEGADLQLSEKVDSKENDLTIIPVSLLTISGNIVDGDGNNLADTPLGFDTLRRMSIVASSDETYVPDVIIKSDGTYSMAVENGTEYTFTALRADDYTLKDPEQKFTASGDHDFVFELKPLNPVTISSNVLDSELATAKFYFTKLDVDENYAEEPDYVYVFKGTENIKVRDGQYRIAVNGKYPVDYYYDLHAGSNEDNIARIQFVTEFNEWVFKTDDFRLNKEYDDSGVHTYRNLVFQGKEDGNKGYLNFGDKDYIDVPITATTAQVWAETCCQASATFPGDAADSPSIVDTSNSTDKFKTHTYDVKDSDKTAGKVRITGKGKCYFTKVWIVDESELLPYSERVEVGADKTYKTIQSAVDAVKNMVRDEVSQNVVIAIDPGNYEETLTIDVDNVTLVNAASKPSTDLKNKGVDIDDNAVRITSYYGEAYNFFSMGSDHGYDALTLDINKKNGYYTTVNGGGSNARDWNATVLVYGDNVTIKDIIMENAFNQYMSAKACDDIWVDKGTAFEGSLDRNDMEPGSIAVQAKTYVERAAALSIRAKNAYFENCRIISRQDTLYGDNSTNAAFYNCSIYGSTDYIMGEMHAVFAKCDLVSNTCNLTDWDSTRKNGKPNSSKATNDGFYVTASKTGAGRGYLLYNCNIVSTTPGIDTASTITAAQGRFGRPWNANVSEAVFFATNIGKTRVKLKTATESNEFVSLVYDDGWDSGLSCESPFMLEFGTHEIAGVDNTAKRTDWAGKPGTLAEAKVPAVKADGQLDGKNMIPLTAANAVETWFGDWNPFVGKDMTIDQTTERSTTYDYEFTKLPDGPNGPDGPDGPNGPEVVDEDKIDATTGDAILSKKTTEKVLSENKALAAAYGDKYFGTKKEPAYLPTLANFEDTATVLNGFVKGKIKKVAISMNGLNEARATVNAKVTVILPEDMREGTVTLKAVSGNTLPTKAKAPKIKKKTGAMTLKALKNTAEYEVVVATATKTLTIRVINLRFEKSLKTIVLRTDNVSANEILTVRPTELGAKKVEQINKPANFLSGLWIIGKDKTPTTTFDTWQTVNVKTKSTQVAPQVMVCSNGVVKLKTNGIYKGSVKLAYVLNGKKYTTVIKFVDKEKNANKKKPSAARATYIGKGLLTTEAKEAPKQAEAAK